MAYTYEPISTTTLGGAQSSVTFSSIPGTYTDLVLIAMVQHTNNSGDQLRVGNGSIDTGSNYSDTYLSGPDNYAAVQAGRISGATSIDVAAKYYSAPTSGYFVPLMINFMNYTSTAMYKTIIARYNDINETNANVGLWRSTSAINTIQLFPGSGINYSTGCTFTLYGIKGA